MTSSHRYGPHRPEDAPNVVTVLGAGRWPQPELRPIPPELVAQRERINTVAHDQVPQPYPCTCGLWHFAPPSCDDGEPVSRDE